MNDDDRFDLLVHSHAVWTYERRRRMYGRLALLLFIVAFAALLLMVLR